MSHQAPQTTAGEVFESDRALGLAHLSLLHCAPPQLVVSAALAEFNFVGLRVRSVTTREPSYDLTPGSSMLRDTLTRMDDTGVSVRDIEFLLLDGTEQRDTWLRMFEAGSALGAKSLTVACADTDIGRAQHALSQMTADGSVYGITPALEPISYQAVNSISLAADLARTAGCTVLIDSLHFGRFNGTQDDVTMNVDLIPLVQLCDAPATRPMTHEGLIHESRSARLAPGDGDMNPHHLLAALSSRVPVSLEVPNEAAVQELGPRRWADYLATMAQKALSSVRGVNS